MEPGLVDIGPGMHLPDFFIYSGYLLKSFLYSII